MVNAFILVTLLAILPFTTAASIGTRVEIKDCSDLGISGVDQFDCKQKDGHYLVNGQCPLGNPKSECKNYCEVRRTGYIGMEQAAPGDPGSPRYADTGIDMQISESFSITKEVNAGLTAGWDTTTKTDATTAGYTSMTKDEIKGRYTRWRFWPSMVSTCGSTTEQQMVTSRCSGMSCTGGSSFAGECKGNPIYKGNVCSTTYQLTPDGKKIAGTFLQQFITNGNKPLAWEEQPESYQRLCDILTESCLNII
ncbi:hypothetical protein BGZ60DRAFT_510242 [Tricladium varicosporioides]|nr:hypothetical protein BGZ60DRAFT_510242 [Hymenoscyphus varicosporioides]